MDRRSGHWPPLVPDLGQTASAAACTANPECARAFLAPCEIDCGASRMDLPKRSARASRRASQGCGRNCHSERRARLNENYSSLTPFDVMRLPVYRVRYAVNAQCRSFWKNRSIVPSALPGHGRQHRVGRGVGREPAVGHRAASSSQRPARAPSRARSSRPCSTSRRNAATAWACRARVPGAARLPRRRQRLDRRPGLGQPGAGQRRDVSARGKPGGSPGAGAAGAARRRSRRGCGPPRRGARRRPC